MGLTGYLIIQKRDINPQSPTYNQIIEDRQLSEECKPTAPDWVELTAYCEYGEDGQPTKQYVHVEIDQAKNSETYGQTREWKEAATEGQCEKANDDPEWILDETYDNHCETKVFKPSMAVGETGRFICRVTDVNVYSPTYGQRVETAYTESDWIFEEEFPCEAVDIRPNVEEISYSCVLSADTSGGMVQTGEIDIFGMDKNPYSSTYLSTTTIRETDIERCPPPSSCEKYGWSGYTLQQGEKDNIGGAVGISMASADTLVLYSKPDWVTYITANTSDDVIAYICKAEDNTGMSRSGDVVFRSPDGKCEFSGTVKQAAPEISVSTNLIISDGSSGGLRVTGSTYTAEFAIAGPNAGTGKLHGILTADTRDKMTFEGEWDGSPGASIYNSCPGSAPQSLYAVGDAHWDLSTNTLIVNLVQCT